jgi:uncharacterized membrane protein
MTLTERPPQPRPATWRSRSGFVWLVLSALAIAVLAPLPYLSTSLQALTRDGSDIAANYVDRPVGIRVALYVHVGLGGLALLLSPLQLAARLRARFTRLHRVTGRIVLASIAGAGCAGLVLAPVNVAGPVGTAGFGALAVLWLVFAATAFRAIRRRDVTGHRRWMLRTFALTYAAVTLRLWLGVLIATQIALFGVDDQVAFDRAYHVVPFLAWVPNLIVVEWYLRRSGRRAER